jgi:hypothetical protein
MNVSKIDSAMLFSINGYDSNLPLFLTQKLSTPATHI